MASDTFTADRAAWLEQVATDERLTAREVRLAIFLNGFVNRDTGDAWPKIATLAEKMRASDRTIQRALRALQDAEHLTIEEGRGRDIPSRYRPLLQASDSCEKGDTDAVTFSSTKGDKHAVTFSKGDTREKVTDFDGKGDRSGSEKVTPAVATREPLKEPLKDKTPPTPSARSRKIDANEASFEKFWKAFPRHEAKGAARKAYTAALAKTDEVTILAGADRYARLRRHEDPKFTKHPSTWLNAEGWLDEPQQVHILATGTDLAPKPASNGRPGALSAADYFMQRQAEKRATAAAARAADDAFDHRLDLEVTR